MGAALGFGRIGSLSGVFIGAWILAQEWPSQRMFFVPLLPLALAAVATLILILPRHRHPARKRGGEILRYVVV